MSDWIVGDVARLSAQITDVARQPSDPGSLVLKIKSGTGAVTTKTHPGEIERVSVGAYRCDVPLTEKGRWMWRWEAGDPHAGACQGQLMVEASNI